jgi:LPXTG-motif cell wall-anchored protein
MTDFNTNQFEDFEEEPASNPPPSKSGGNRNFLLAIGVLGAISLLTLIVLIVVGLVILPARNKTRKEEAAQINAQNTATALAATQLAKIQQEMVTATPSATLEPTSTPVVAIATLTEQPLATETPNTPSQAQDLSARTQTVAALLTQAASSKTTVTATPKTTSLPTTGFADEVGLPAMIGIAVLLIAVIFLVRRLRTAPTS